MKLTSENVENVFMDSLCPTLEFDGEGITVEGIIANYRFDARKIKQYENDIESMLSELPDEFKEDVGGGWSFLNSCVDRNGHQWTDFHQRMEQLFCLGLATGKVVCQTTRDLWKILPGGMPYYMILK